MKNHRAGMFVYALAYLSGITFVQQLSVLPEMTLLVSLSFAALCLYLIIRYFLCQLEPPLSIQYLTLTNIVILLILLGIIYSSLFAKYRFADRLDESVAGQNIIITGRISSIPITAGKAQRFEFDVRSHRLIGKDASVNKRLENFPKKIRLSWYYAEVYADEQWQLEVRLKPPHGFMNPGGYDYEGWLFQHGIQATGYVRKSAFNKRSEKAAWWSINTIRQSLSQQIDQMTEVHSATGSSMSLVKALAIGDKSSISAQQWRVMASTGTSHLMAISGLHIGLAALFCYVLIRRLTPIYIIKRIPAQHVALIASMLSGLLYALIAGLSIPTQRAIIMLCVLSVMMLLRRNNRPVDSLGFALFAVLLIDPLAVLSAGFWFSFSAVAVIFISLSSDKSSNTKQTTWFSRMRIVARNWLKLQLLISVFLLPLSLFMFQQASLVSPLANLLLIPYVSFLVVPVVLLAIIASWLARGLSDQLFSVACWLLDIIWPVLSFLSEQPYAYWAQGDINISELLLATIALLLMLYSRRILSFLVSRFSSRRESLSESYVALGVFRTAACVLILPLFLSDKQSLNRGDFQLTVLDVGQGSAAVIQTQNHLLVFDSGAKFSDKLDAGSGVVIPYLRSQGITGLDRLIISHGDADHIGGAPAIIQYYSDVEVIGQDIENLDSNNKRACHQGDAWYWDGVKFSFLSPDSEAVSLSPGNKRNNRSCVLRVSSSSASVLLTGDIEKEVEQELIELYGDSLLSDVLIVPHHGSNSSSIQEFVSQVGPKISIISAGYRNRYKLPSQTVLSRYKQSGSKIMETDKMGAITIKMHGNDGIFVESYRQMARKYWHHRLD